MFKLLIVAFSCIVCLQGFAEAATYIEAINAVEDARRAIDVTSNYGVQITELDLVKLQELRKNRENLYLRYQLYFSVIQELNNTAATKGIVVSDCLKDYPNLTDNYAKVIQFQNANCVHKNVTAVSNLTKAVIELNKNRNVPFSLLQDLSGCEDDACINKVTETAKNIVKSVPDSLVALVTSNELLVYKTSTSLPECQTSIETGLQAAVGDSQSILACLSKRVYAALYT